MKKKLKNSLLFSLVCYGILVFLNAIGWVVIELVPFLFHGNNPFYKLQGVTLLFYIPFVFAFSLGFGTRKVSLYFPLFYLIISVALLGVNVDFSYVLYLFTSGFSQFFFVGYDLLRKLLGLNSYEILDLVLFNGIFFIYQVCLLYYSNKLLRKIKEKFNF